MRILHGVTTAVTVALATVAAASSNARAPLRSIALAKNADILTPNHRATAVSTFDVAFEVSGQRIRLSLEPNHDLFVDGGRISYLNADGSIAQADPIDRLQHKIYKGTAWARRGNRWDKVGWARIGLQQDGLHPLFEGTFTVQDDHHHVKLSSNYKATRMDEDPDIDLRDDEYMVVFRDSDMGIWDEHSELRKRSASVGCPADELVFNTHEDHPIYASMRARDVGFSAAPISSLFGKRQIDGQPGGNGAGVNLVSTIGNTAGCPTTRKVALVGVAVDCTYIQSFNRDKNLTQQNVIRQMNAASELFESTFNISLGLANLIVPEAECPTSQQQATPWNQGCSGNIKIQDRLNLFSQWRGQQNDQYSHWTLLSTCNTGSAVGLAWLGQACTSGSQGNNGKSNETVAGANVVIRTSTEWQVIAHETGHTYGAVHDCTADQCANSNIVNSQQCCPLSAGTCNAGAGFIMNPSTAEGITRFSACSIGNVCSALLRNSVKSSCFTNNKDVTTITGQTCGNGIVEGDEQCDCGGDTGCANNKCCDPKTCKFKNSAVCDDSNEDCCRDCKFAPANTVCRKSVGECDPQETCTGSGPYCPKDQTKEDGAGCGNGMSCASGQCTSRDMQCKTVMGSYTKGNDTYACDNSNCMLSCASPQFGSNVCYGLQQNFLDGTPCTAGGRCSNGQCKGGSIGKEISSWIDRHLGLVIGLAAGIGGLIVLCILNCCWRSYRRRSKLKKYAAAAAPHPDAFRGPPQNRGPMSPPGTGTGIPLMSQQNGGWAAGPPPMQGQWGPNPNHNVPAPPPLAHRSSVRYA
ncbi:ADAM 8 precursor [Cucurbitaria berberidis CBS 394.84]|uniref:Disintegrin and metalloproteinase domain-containing protein B n=1 Tax=Cucurbitaria berberidis CBS 394.84 TaxID=1168544 RepID=A0A9P4GUA9_9PLEO|nr:ADAM 8 precursor [Cucurbitaria berberidis CBS 394.84]KAF1851957.1 ADAM 8 precursor [Cucurbitaria berberidis CBS 394.84]